MDRNASGKDRNPMRAVLQALVGYAAVTCAVACLGDDASSLREPVPSNQVLSDSQRKLDATYQVRDRKTPQAKRQVVVQLCALIDDPASTSTERYAALKTLLELTVELNDPGRYLETLDELTSRYEVDSLAERAASLKRFVTTTAAPAALHALLDEVVETAIALSAANQFTDGYQLLQATSEAAGRLGLKGSTPQLIANARERISARQDAFRSLGQAERQLDRNPDDGSANFRLGQWYGIYEKDWPKALPYLSKASDLDWKAAARLEIDAADAAPKFADVADAWWSLAVKEKGSETSRNSLQQHAAEWYLRAEPRIESPTRKQVVANRLSQLGFNLPKAEAVERQPGKTKTEQDSSIPKLVEDLQKLAKIVKLTSEGLPYGNSATIRINDKLLVEADESDRGLHVVTYDRGKTRYERFNFIFKKSDVDRFVDYIGKLPKGTGVVIAVSDSPGIYFDQRASKAISSLGGIVDLTGKRRWSYYLIGIKGMGPREAIEDLGQKPLRYPE
jgi:hypothetical protein